MRVYFIFCLLLISASVFASTSQGHIIILDGTSNAGKTSVTKPLLSLLGNRYTLISLDDYVTDLWLQKRKGYLPEQEFVDKIHHRVDAMYDDVRSLVLTGKNVVLDTIISGLAGEDDRWRCFEKLRGLPVFMVLVYCPFHVVVERMKQGNKEALVQNEPGRIRPIVVSAKFGDIYQVAKEGDVILGILTKGDVERAYKIEEGAVKQEKMMCELLKSDLLSKFDLYDKEEVEITPCLRYDCIINTTTYTPDLCAQKIFDCFVASNYNIYYGTICRR